MNTPFSNLTMLLAGDGHRDRVVPPTGFTATLTSFTSAAMAFLVVFAMALSFASSRLSDRWGDALANSSTLRISAPADQIEVQLAAAMQVLTSTAGIAEATIISKQDQQKLLEPWFGPDVPLEMLPVPVLIDIQETAEGFDAQGLRLRLAAEVPAAVLDDHSRWRRPIVAAADRLALLGWVSILLIIGASVAMITLAARAALAANAQVIAVLRLVGAQDNYIAAAFVRRFAARAFVGAAGGMCFGAIAILFLPSADQQASILTGLRFQGADWLWLLMIPIFAAVVAFVATRTAALKVLGELS